MVGLHGAGRADIMKNTRVERENTMIQVEKILPGLWTFPIVLPDNPLKWLNCYVIKPEEGGRGLLIDTGFNRPECLEALLSGIEALGLGPDNTDVFITHAHADHVGCAGALYERGYRILMGRTDREIEQLMRSSSGDFGSRSLAEGMTEEILTFTSTRNQGRNFRSTAFEARLLEDGDELRYGDFTLRCLLMPGHTPGHMCLYEAEKGIIFLGDHVLFDISPNIIAWPWMEDSLSVYMASLRRIREYPVKLALPAHRARGSVSMAERIDVLLAHHELRLAEAEAAIAETPGMTAYEIAGHMTWKIRASSWDDFPPGQKWFAFWETLAHLDCLIGRGRIERRMENGWARYYRK